MRPGIVGSVAFNRQVSRFVATRATGFRPFPPRATLPTPQAPYAGGICPGSRLSSSSKRGSRTSPKTEHWRDTGYREGSGESIKVSAWSLGGCHPRRRLVDQSHRSPMPQGLSKRFPSEQLLVAGQLDNPPSPVGMAMKLLQEMWIRAYAGMRSSVRKSLASRRP